MSNNKRYFIRRTSLRFGRVDYKKNKCVDGWSSSKAQCWQFSRSGAMEIIKSLQAYADRTKNHPASYQYVYDLVEGTLDYSGRDPYCA